MRDGEFENLLLSGIVSTNGAHVLIAEENCDVLALKFLAHIGQVVLDVLTAQHNMVKVRGGALHSLVPDGDRVERRRLGIRAKLTD